MQWHRITGPELLQKCKNDFEGTALELYRYQYEHNELYRRYNEALRIEPEQVQTLAQIPFLPISFFKTHKVVSGNWQQETLLFESSGTTGDTPSRHFVKDASLYEAALLHGFREFYGDPAGYALLGLLPSYLERSTSSLVHMARELMQHSKHPDNGFYLNEWEPLSHKLRKLQAEGQPTLLIGVTFALLDFSEAYPMPLPNITVMETGGMKGRKTEWTRTEVHQHLGHYWQLPKVHSEYGMTELLSQAYAPGDGLFTATATMKVLVRDLQDPLDVTAAGLGAINVIDLANVHSCAFIATEDIGRLQADGRFEVLGRMDHAVLRGCSLMAL